MFISNQTVANDPLHFTLPALKGAQVYRLNEAVISVTIKMVKPDGTKLDSTSMSAPINGISNTLWSKSLVEINSTPINSSTDFHWLKYYLSSIIDSTRGQMIAPKSGKSDFFLSFFKQSI